MWSPPVDGIVLLLDRKMITSICCSHSVYIYLLSKFDQLKTDWNLILTNLSKVWQRRISIRKNLKRNSILFLFFSNLKASFRLAIEGFEDVAQTKIFLPSHDLQILTQALTATPSYTRRHLKPSLFPTADNLYFTLNGKPLEDRAPDHRFQRFRCSWLWFSHAGSEAMVA